MALKLLSARDRFEISEVVLAESGWIEWHALATLRISTKLFVKDVWLTPDAWKPRSVMDRQAVKIRICQALGNLMGELNETELLGITFVMVIRNDSYSSSATGGAVGRLEVDDHFLFTAAKEYLNGLPNDYLHEVDLAPSTVKPN